MSQSDQEIVVQADELREFACTLYRKAGVSREHAELMAELQVETDLRGEGCIRTGRGLRPLTYRISLRAI